MRSSRRTKERRITVVLAIMLVAVVALVVASKKMSRTDSADESSLFKTTDPNSLDAIFADDVVTEEPVQTAQTPASEETVPDAPAEPVTEPEQTADTHDYNADDMIAQADEEKKAASKPSEPAQGVELNVSVGGEQGSQEQPEGNDENTAEDQGDEEDKPVKEEPPVLNEVLPAVDEVETVEPVPLEPEYPKKYVVKSGDTLSTIAKKFYGRSSRWRIIMDANDMKDPHMLKIGAELIIPDQNSPRKAKSEGEKDTQPKVNQRNERGNSPDRNDGSYVVQRNDSLWKIAASVYGDGTKWREVFEANRDKLPNKDALRVGQVLTIP